MAVDVVQTGVTQKDFVVLPSAARTAAPNDQQFNISGRYTGFTVVVDVTAIVTAPSITVTVAGVDPVSGKVVTLLASAAITTVSTVRLMIHPALTVVANAAASAVLPSAVRISVSHTNGNSITYSVGASLA